MGRDLEIHLLANPDAYGTEADFLYVYLVTQYVGKVALAQGLKTLVIQVITKGYIFNPCSSKGKSNRNTKATITKHNSAAIVKNRRIESYSYLCRGGVTVTVSINGVRSLLCIFSSRGSYQILSKLESSRR